MSRISGYAMVMPVASRIKFPKDILQTDVAYAIPGWGQGKAEAMRSVLRLHAKWSIGVHDEKIPRLHGVRASIPVHQIFAFKANDDAIPQGLVA